MKKMLKRADGSYSQRGLWDNIRANKGSGKEPTEEMKKQENKLKNMSKKYQTAGPVTTQSDSTAVKNKKVASDMSKKYMSDVTMLKILNNPTKSSPSGYKSAAALPRINMQSPERIATMKETGGPGKKRSDRVAMRSDKKKAKAEKLTDTYNDLVTNYDSSDTSNYDAYASKLLNKIAMATERSKELKQKSESLKVQGKKTGGKKSDWLKESQELKFGGKPKKRMGGKNC